MYILFSIVLSKLLIVCVSKNHPFSGTWSVSVCTNSSLNMFRMLFDIELIDATVQVKGADPCSPKYSLQGDN